MSRAARKYGRSTDIITDQESGEVLGWAIEWDNGGTTRLMSASLPAWMTARLDERGKPGIMARSKR